MLPKGAATHNSLANRIGTSGYWPVKHFPEDPCIALRFTIPEKHLNCPAPVVQYKATTAWKKRWRVWHALARLAFFYKLS